MSKRTLLVIGVFFVSLSSQGAGEGNSLSTFNNAPNPSGNVAIGWMHLLSDLLREEAIPPPNYLRLYAYAGMALYESQVPALPGYQSVFTCFLKKFKPTDHGRR